MILYNLAIFFYGILIQVFAWFHPKAKQFVLGRKNWKLRLNEQFETNTAPVVWFHAASLGEFEQGRPVIEEFAETFPSYKILLTFFSPSGYEIRKDYQGADWICYLPLDTPQNARFFIETVQPKLVFFIKYEFWHHYIGELAARFIPIISFSTIFRKEQYFFKWYGKWAAQTLGKINHFFVQNDSSMELLAQLGLPSASRTGDTRFDRVKQICERKKSIPIAEKFKNKQILLVVGSAWMQDMEVIGKVLAHFEQPLKIIIAPHEIGETNLKNIEKTLAPLQICRFSQANEKEVAQFDVLLIDNIGMLSSLYQYGDFAYIGGGFGAGLHNTLEAATFGMPIFGGGTAHQKFQEVVDLIELGGVFCVENAADFKEKLSFLYQNQAARAKASQISENYVMENLGATEQILSYVQDCIIRGN